LIKNEPKPRKPMTEYGNQRFHFLCELRTLRAKTRVNDIDTRKEKRAILRQLLALRKSDLKRE
jgi:hypothetical protein